MPVILTVLLLLLFAGCDKFSETQFIKEAFGADLSEYIRQKPSTYKDGLLIISNVSESEWMYQQVFASGSHTGRVSIEIGGQPVLEVQHEEIRYIVKGSFDGYQRIIFYIPSKRKLCFGYASAML